MAEQKLVPAQKTSPGEWKRWWAVCLAGMFVFAVLVFFMRGRWSPRAARRDLAEHDRIVTEELAKLAGSRPAWPDPARPPISRVGGAVVQPVGLGSALIGGGTTDGSCTRWPAGHRRRHALDRAHDLWTSRAPAKYADRVPARRRAIDGRPTWVVDGNVIGFAGGGGVIDRDGAKIRVLEALYEWTLDGVHQGAFDPRPASRCMDDIGHPRPGLLPQLLGLGGQGSPTSSTTRRSGSSASDLQRRHGRGAGRLGPPVPPHAA